MKSTSFGEQAVYFYVKKIFPETINRYRKGRFELDIYIPEIQTGIEFDGFYFHSGNESLEREKRKYERCQELGIKLIRLKDSNSMNGQCYADETFGIENLKDRNQLNTLIRLLLQKIDPQSNMLTKRNPKQDWSTIDNLIDVEKDLYKHHELLWKGFDHEGEVPLDEDTIRKQKEMLSAPHLNTRLHVIAKNKSLEFVSYCGLWYNESTNYVYVEPVCTIPQYRKKGIAKYILTEALKRAYDLGAKKGICYFGYGIL